MHHKSHNILLDGKKNMENWIKVGALGKWIQMAYNKAGISSVGDFRDMEF